ncbi:MAG: hypothetical protein ACLQVJ_11355 [Syntrophobacteraceae bacterium]
MKTLVYIDGFNFYYNAVKNTAYKWLDFKAISVALLKHYNVGAFRRFWQNFSG